MARRPRHSRSKRRAPAADFRPRDLELGIDRLSHDGRGMARDGRKTVFVAGALPGEHVSARTTAESSRFIEARATDIKEPSPQRVAPVCRYFGECGGCQLQHMGREQQLASKEAAVLDQLRRFAGLTPERVLTPLSDSGTGYRAKVRLAVWMDADGQRVLGFRRAGSKRLVAIGQCPVMEPALEAMIEPLAQWLEREATTGVTHIELLAAEQGPGVIVRYNRPLPDQAWQTLGAVMGEHGGQLWLQAGKQAFELTNLHGEPVDPRLTYVLDDGALELAYHPADFTQVNRAVNRQMVDRALALLAPQPDEHVLDLFCGIGNFSLPLARRAVQVTGVEAVDSMVERAGENARRNGLHNISFIGADLTRMSPEDLARRIGVPDAILLDPPRDGARALCQRIAALGPSRIVYVSCNPATLARDSAELVEAGYRLVSVGIMDMFAQTAHIETMALFTRR